MSVFLNFITLDNNKQYVSVSNSVLMESYFPLLVEEIVSKNSGFIVYSREKQ